MFTKYFGYERSSKVSLSDQPNLQQIRCLRKMETSELGEIKDSLEPRGSKKFQRLLGICM